MWQLKIIIEMSSRKELLGPIWSLPRDQAALFPPAHSPALSRLVETVWRQPSLRRLPELSRLMYSCRGFCLQHGILISHKLQLRGA